MINECGFCKGTGIEPGHIDCVWCDNTGRDHGIQPDNIKRACSAIKSANKVHRYKAVTMLSAAGATLGYDPHGPDVVMAAEFDRATAERDALQQRLTAADERADVLGGLLLQTNELLYAIQGDPGDVPSSAIDAMRGKVFTALKPAEGGGDDA